MARNRRTSIKNQQLIFAVADRKKAVGYVRVSTNEQAESGHSIAAQKSKITKYCEENSIELVEIFSDEGISGYNVDPDKREGFNQAIINARENYCNTFIIVKRDRLSRVAFSQQKTIYQDLPNIALTVECIDEPINYDSPEAKMLSGILAQFAEYEVEKIKERTKAAISHLKDTGQAYTSAKFGFSKVGDKRNNGDKESRFVKNESEQAIIKDIVRLYKGGLTWRQTVAQIEARHGKKLHPNSARRIFLRVEKERLGQK